jgi:hypothetical protein
MLFVALWVSIVRRFRGRPTQFLQPSGQPLDFKLKTLSVAEQVEIRNPW